MWSDHAVRSVRRRGLAEEAMQAGYMCFRSTRTLGLLSLFGFVFLFASAMLGVEPRSLSTLGKLSTIELKLQSYLVFFVVFYLSTNVLTTICNC